MTRPPRATPQDHAHLDFLTVRDRFLSAFDSADEEAEWLIEVGLFVQHCWLAEEYERAKLEQDEVGHEDLWPNWGTITEAQFRETRARAQQLFADYARRRGRKIITDAIKEKFKPVDWLLNGVGWFFREAFKGVVHAVGVVLLGLVILAATPHLVRSVRTLLNDILPAYTAPSAHAAP